MEFIIDQVNHKCQGATGNENINIASMYAMHKYLLESLYDGFNIDCLKFG